MPTDVRSPLGTTSPPWPRGALARRALRAGFTFIEILMVFVIFGILVSIAAPRLASMRGTSSVKTAMQKVTAMTVTARSEARRRKRPAYLFVTRDSIWVLARTAAGGTTRVGMPLRLGQELDVATTLSPSLDSVVYDVRGIGLTYHAPVSTDSTGRAIKLKFTGGRKTDSLCISGSGLIAGCGL